MFSQFSQKYAYPSFCCFFRLPQTSQRKFCSVFSRSFQANIITRVFLTLFDYLPSEVKEYKISFLGAFPKADMIKAAGIFSSKFSCDYTSEGDYGKVERRRNYRRCQLSGGVRICNRHLPLASLRVPTVCSIAHQSCCIIVCCHGSE